ncbi:MAG: magnesium chelatase [Syntrophomonadaceae bacterium]|jgi:magnesium chelatase subunit I|nr:magnesium chelatase [Syntrophomonadaceae bacterium]
MKPYYALARHDGNQPLFNLVEMSIVSTLAGQPLHLHAEGLRGTGKTTIMRAARELMPKITRISGCIYNCDPEKPHCPLHRHMSREEIMALGTEEIDMPFLEISHSAKVGTVAGSIDLAKITDVNNPQAALLPGIIPQAHRGIIFIDEINRLADTSPEITDILLDVMGNKPGRLQIEEAGLPTVELTIQVSVWAASNPDEDPGPLEEVRRQLSDRFDMVVYMGRPGSVDVVVKMLEGSDRARREEVDPRNYEAKNREFRQRAVEMASTYKVTELPDFLRSFIARVYIKHNLESIRAIEAVQQGAVLYSILKKHKQIMINDVIEMLPLALKHRVDGDTLIKIMNGLESRSSRDSILNIKDRRISKATKEREETYFEGGARRLKDMGRQEIIATEKALNPNDF